MTTGEAARLLGCLPITVRRRIERGELAGGQRPSGKWWLYADQVGAVPALAPAPLPLPRNRDLLAENAALRRQLQDITTTMALERVAFDARHRGDRNRIAALLALQAANLTAAQSYQSASEGALELARKSAEVISRFQAAADEWQGVAGMYRDLVAADNMPDDPGQLDDLSR